MKKAFLVLGSIAWSVVLFGAGFVYREHQLLHAGRFSTTQPLTLSAGLQQGFLPVGTSIYRYRENGDQPLFVVFIGTKDLSSLKAKLSEHWLEISPLDAYLR